MDTCGAAIAACRAEAAKIDRDPATVALTVRNDRILDLSSREACEKTVEALLPYAKLGASHFVLMSFAPPDEIGDVVRALMRDVKPALEAARPG